MKKSLNIILGVTILVSFSDVLKTKKQWRLQLRTF